MLINCCMSYTKKLLRKNHAPLLHIFKCNRKQHTCIQKKKLLCIRQVNFLITRQNSYFKHKYSDAIQFAINQQIQAEQQAAQEYLAMAVMFLHPSISRPGTGGFFMKMYEEELDHMQSFIQYQLLRGGTVLVKNIKTPGCPDDLTMCASFHRALTMEKSVTELLENLISVAEKAKDYHCADYVTSAFLTEQMQSVSKMAHHITKLSRLSDEASLYLYDLKLAESHPITYKLKPPGTS